MAELCKALEAVAKPDRAFEKRALCDVEAKHPEPLPQQQALAAPSVPQEHGLWERREIDGITPGRAWERIDGDHPRVVVGSPENPRIRSAARRIFGEREDPTPQPRPPSRGSA